MYKRQVAAAFDDATDPVDLRIGRYACLGQCQYFFSFRIVEEFAVRIEQFERIPLFLSLIHIFYLFFINTVFIAIATYMVVRFLKYEKHSFLDSKKERKVRRSMVLIVLVTLIPSVVIGYRIVKRSVFEANADRLSLIHISTKTPIPTH